MKHLNTDFFHFNIFLFSFSFELCELLHGMICNDITSYCTSLQIILKEESLLAVLPFSHLAFRLLFWPQHHSTEPNNIARNPSIRSRVAMGSNGEKGCSFQPSLLLLFGDHQINNIQAQQHDLVKINCFKYSLVTSATRFLPFLESFRL